MTSALRHQANRDLAQRSVPGVFAYLILWGIVAAFGNLTDSAPWLIWSVGGAYALLAILRLALVWRFDHLHRRSPDGWRRLFALGALSSGALWGGFCGIALFVGGLDASSVLVLLPTAGIAAATAAALAPLGGVLLAMQSLLLWPAIPMSILAGDALGVGVALMFLTYYAFLVLIGRRLHEEYWRGARQNAELEALAGRMRSILDTVVDGIITIDERGRVETFNPAAERIFGYGAGEVIGRNVNMLMPEPFHSAHDGYLANYLDTGQRRIIGIGREVMGRRKDGSVFPLDLAVSETSLGGRRVFTGLVRDITERKRAQEALSQFKGTLDRTLDCVFMFEPDTLRFFYVNQGAMAQVGYDHAELMAMHPYDIKPDMPEARFREFIAPLLRGEQNAITFEIEHRHKDGHHIPVEIFLQYIAPEGEQARFVAIVRDITERKKVERLKNEFVSTVSHELRTPLTSIRGALGLIASGMIGTIPDKAKYLNDIAHKNSERLLRLINDILDIEKIESGRMRFVLRPHSIRALIEQSIVANAAYGQQYRVGFHLLEGGQELTASVDADRFMQVMANLLSNAAKFSPAEGKVDIAVERHGASVRVSVRDQGAGIPEEFHSRVFQKFSQADSSDTRAKGGTGLGLNIVQAIIEQFGGSIDFETGPDGTTFFFDLPLHRL